MSGRGVLIASQLLLTRASMSVAGLSSAAISSHMCGQGLFDSGPYG
jgi:hypothetical protein